MKISKQVFDAWVQANNFGKREIGSITRSEKADLIIFEMGWNAGVAHVINEHRKDFANECKR